MTCKDCVHYEVCFDYTHLKYSENLPDNREDVCEHFKNKANVVEVVRCKDCKYFEIDEEDELGECKCGNMAMSYCGVLYPQRNDFCRYGERKCDNG